MRELSGFAAMHSDDVRAKNTASMILGLGKWSARRFAKYSDAANVAKTGISSRLNIECPNIIGENPSNNMVKLAVRQLRQRFASKAAKIIPMNPNIAFVVWRTLRISQFVKTSDSVAVSALNHPLYIGCELWSMLVSLPKLL